MDGVAPKHNHALQVAGVPVFFQMTNWKDAKVFCFLMSKQRDSHHNKMSDTGKLKYSPQILYSVLNLHITHH